MKNSNGLKIFILEDDNWYGSMLQHYLSLNPDFEVKRFENSKDFFGRLYEIPDVVTLDYSMPDMDGSEVLKRIKEAHPSIQVIIISGQEDVSTAINLLKNGAFDYIVKDESVLEHISNTLNKLFVVQDYLKKKRRNNRFFFFCSVIVAMCTVISYLYEILNKS